MACEMIAFRRMRRILKAPIIWIRVLLVYIWLKLTKPKQRIELWDLNSNDATTMGALIPQEHFTMENGQHPIGSDISDSILIYGSNSGGASLVVRVCRNREGHVAWLYLKLADGRSYQLPYPDRCYPPMEGFIAEGLRIKCLLPMKKWKVSYNGILRKNSEDNDASSDNPMVHVKFSFLVFMNSFPFDFKTDIDPRLLSDYLGRRNILKTERITHFLDSYVQPCNIMGTFEVDSMGEMEVYLWGMRKRSRDIKSDGPRESLQWKEIFGYSKEGQMIYSVEYLFPGSEERFSFGHFVERNSLIWPVKSCKNTFDFHKDMFTGLRLDIKTAMCKVRVDVSKPAKTISFITDNVSLHVAHAHLTCMRFLDGDEGPALVIEHTGTRYETRILDKLEWRLSSPDAVPVKLSSKPYLISLDDPDCEKSTLSGGKGSSLASLNYIVRKYTSNFDVPRGFVITTRAYWEFCSRANLHPFIAECESSARLNDNTKLIQACDELVKRVSSSKLPAIIQEAIRKQLLATFNADFNNRRFAVRSSASGEDSEEMSAAGQMSTILGVEGLQNITEAIVKCWASQFSFTAVQYKRQNGQELNSPMAVVVQEMVPAHTAGVLFTCDPVTGNPQNVTITANYGLGESVVSASAEPDTIVLFRDENNGLSLQSIQVGSKNSKVVMSDVGNVIEKSNDEVDTTLCCLSNQEAQALAEICIKVEGAYGYPIDIEWAIKDGNIHLLQARPVTTLHKDTAFESIHCADTPLRIEDAYFTKANIGEVMPGCATALTGSVINTAITFQLQSFFSKRNKYLVPFSPFNPMAWGSQGQSFFNLVDNFLKLDGEIRAKKPIFAEAMIYAAFGRNIEDPEIFEQVKKRHSNYPWIFLPLQAIYGLGDYLCAEKRLDKMVKEVWDWEIDLKNCSNAKEMINHTVKEIIKGPNGMASHILNTGLSIIFNSILLSILAEENKGFDATVFNDFSLILSSCGQLESANIPLSIQRLTMEIRKEIDIKKFKEMDPEDALNWLETTTSCSGKLFKEFLRRHGHRCLREMELFSKTWRINKLPLVITLQNSVLESSNEKKQELSTQEVMSRLQVPLSRKAKFFLRKLIPRCRKSVFNREKSKSMLIKMVDCYRKAFWTVAEQVVKEGRMSDVDHVFALSHHELLQLIDTRSPTLIQRAIRRKQLGQELDSRQYLEIIKGIPKAINIGNKTEPNNFNCDLEMKGTPVSRGIAKGLARVATNLTEASKIQPGEILIAYCTDIAWSPYFPLLSGVATELGGLISHGAVVAREYGLPCVVGLHDATNRFRTGKNGIFTLLLEGDVVRKVLLLSRGTKISF